MTQTLVVTAGQLARKTGTTGKPSMTPDQNQSQGDHPDSQTDLQLVRKVRNGDRAAFDLLVVKYQSRVASIISRYVYDPQEVMDLAQETFVKAYRAIDRFPGRQRLLHLALPDRRQHRQELSGVPPGVAPSQVPDVAEAENFDDGRRLRDPASPERLLQREQLQEALSRAIAQLPEDLRSAFLLREYDGLSYEDIARILDCPIGTVRSRIFRARDAVDRYLGPLLNPSETV